VASVEVLCPRRQWTPNDKGNRPAAKIVTEDQGMNRRVRLTVRLGIVGDAIADMHFAARHDAGP
jgi:hypothetical protein